MALNYTPRCTRCRKKMRNDGTEEKPIWVCDNPKCVRYVPPGEVGNTVEIAEEEK